MDVDELDAFDEALNLESKFYAEGYADGLAHGRQHGLFEGRQLGQEQAWKVWDEVGFYEGFAGVWILKCGDARGRREVKALQHARALLSLVSTFPTTNPSDSTQPLQSETFTPPADPLANIAIPARSRSGSPASLAGSAAAADEADLSQLLDNIRARYRLLCTAVGARPRLQPGTAGGVVEGIEGPMKGVDTAQLRF